MVLYINSDTSFFVLPKARSFIAQYVQLEAYLLDINSPALVKF